MKRSTRLLISSIATITFSLGCLGFAVADTTASPITLPNGTTTSTGIIEINQGDKTARFDAKDLNLIYDEVSSGRTDIAEAINSLGSHSLDGNQVVPQDISFTALTDATLSQFDIPEEMIGNTVSNEMNTEATAIAAADNLSLGTMAWDDDGTLLIGTGQDNINFYNSGVVAGKASTMPAGLEYVYHHHTLGTKGDADTTSKTGGTYSNSYQSSSSRGCFTKAYYKWQWSESNGHACYGPFAENGFCETCGGWTDFSHDYHWVDDGSVTKTQWAYSSPHSGAKKIQTVYLCNCGYQDGQLVGARIVY